MRLWIMTTQVVLLTLAWSGTSRADPPKAYKCGAGKPIAGTGCECPKDKLAERDKDNVAICAAKKAPVVRRDPPPPPARVDRVTQLAGTLANDADSKARLSAALELAKIVKMKGDRRAVDALIGALKDQEKTVRAVAATGLGSLTSTKDILDAIVALDPAQSDADSFVRTQMKGSLAKLRTTCNADEDCKISLARLAAEKLEKDGDFKGCAKAYEAIRKAHPGSEADAELLYNVGVCYERAGELALANKARGALIDLHPMSDLAGRAMPSHGRYLLEKGDMGGCGKVFYLYGRRYAGEKDAPRALYDGAYCFKQGGHIESAVMATDVFIQNFGNKRYFDLNKLFIELFQDDPAISEQLKKRLKLK